MGEEQKLETNQKSCVITLGSKKKLFYVGLAIAVLNPIFSGLVFGIAFLNEPNFQKEAKIITLVSILWGLITAFAAFYLRRYGYMIY